MEVYSNEVITPNPTDTEFIDYLEQTLNPPNVEKLDVDVHTYVYIPILDDPITQQELNEQTGRLKSNNTS